MGVLDRFEKGVENAVQSAFAKTFRSGVKPVELASAIKRECDTKAAAVDRERTVAPNEYTIKLSEADHANLSDWGIDALEYELAGVVTEHAAGQRYAFPGAVGVAIELDESLSTGRFAVSSRSTRGPASPAASAKPDTRYPLLDIDGSHFHLTGAMTVVGRGDEADITIQDTGISRAHARFEVTDQGTILADLGSTNGTYVEGQRISEVTLLDGNTITVGRTRINYWEPVPSENV